MSASSPLPTQATLEPRLKEFEQLAVPCIEWVDTINSLARVIVDVDSARAQQLCKEALRLSGELKYVLGAARSLTLTSWLNLVQGRPDLSLTRAVHAQTLARTIDDAQQEGHALYVEAMVHDQVGNFEEAQQSRQKMISIARNLGDRSLEANCLTTMGMQHSRFGDHAKALSSYLAALRIYRELKDEREVMALNNAASALTRIGDLSLALDFAGRALENCNTDNVRVHTQILHTMGGVHAAQGEVDVALSYHQRAIDLNANASERGQVIDQEFEITVRLDVATLQRTQGLLAECIATLEHALTVAQAIDAKPLLVELHDQLSKVYRETDQVALALTQAEQREVTRTKLQKVEAEQSERVMKVMSMLRTVRDPLYQQQRLASMNRA